MVQGIDVGAVEVAVSRAALPGDGPQRLAGRVGVRTWPRSTPPTASELAELARGCAGLVALGTDRIDAALLDACPTVRVVGLASMGYDAVDLDAARERSVVVSHTPRILQETTADIAFLLILAARRRAWGAERALRAGEWTHFEMTAFLGLDVHGARLGIAGYGQIGRAVARRAAGFGMDVVHYDPFAQDDDEQSRFLPLDELLATADIVSVHLPLQADTRGFFGAERFAAMKRTATFVNTSRGGVVDQQALVQALRDGTIHSAGIDVLASEPLADPSDPVLGLDNLVVFPHIGSATEATRAAMVDLAVDNVLDVLDGRSARTPIPELA